MISSLIPGFRVSYYFFSGFKNPYTAVINTAALKRVVILLFTTVFGVILAASILTF